MRVTAKILSLLALLQDRPSECYDRLATIGEVRLERLWTRRPTYDTTDWRAALRKAGACFGARPDVPLGDTALVDVERTVVQRLADIGPAGPFSHVHNADLAFARCCYVLCRFTAPRVVVETGVAYGVTSSFILAALERNGRGTLVSVDLPPLGSHADDFVGAVVPAELRGRWQLHRGPSKRLLPGILRALGRVDVFVHDSLHTYLNMRREFQAAWAHLPHGGIILADDIEGNGAFRDLRQLDPRFWCAVGEAEKTSLFGIAVR